MTDYINSYTLHDILKAYSQKDRYILETERTGNLDFLNIVIDMEEVIKEANLTIEEHFYLNGYLREGRTLVELSKICGVSHQTVHNRLYEAYEKIEKVLRSWEKCF